ncbi:MAG: glycosyltransferase [Desulfobulbaceae bacterium]|jgi:glycosyltransferase|nr:glycosyltransferase [Desulfobulbaceae bacterium]
MTQISIITASRNAENTIGDCLKSVARQTKSCEHLLIDGASTDGTVSVLEQYHGHAILWHSESDKGVYDAMNKGIFLAKGQIIGLLNADDRYASDDILATVAATFADPGVDACYGDLCYVAADNPEKIVRYWRAGSYSPQSFYWGWMPPHPTFFVRRELYERYGGFNLALGSAADYELMLRFLLKWRRKAVYIPKILVNMRLGGLSNRTLANRLRANRNDRLAWKINDLRPFPWTLLAKPLRKIGQWWRKPAVY